MDNSPHYVAEDTTFSSDSITTSSPLTRHVAQTNMAGMKYKELLKTKEQDERVKTENFAYVHVVFVELKGIFFRIFSQKVILNTFLP